MVEALRRQFLMDLTYPVPSPVICQLLGLQEASEDVQQMEGAETHQRMDRLAKDPLVGHVLFEAAQDAMVMLDLVEDPLERAAWLGMVILAGVNLLEDIGKVEVTP